MTDISKQPDAGATAPAQAGPKAEWAKPVIESYDVAEFTLSNNGNNAGDGAFNRT